MERLQTWRAEIEAELAEAEAQLTIAEVADQEARAAVLAKRVEDSRLMFERTLEVSHDPHVIAWSHIYLGRIYDYQPRPNRELAIVHYKAALAAGDASPDTKTAAEKGLAAAPKRAEN